MRLSTSADLDWLDFSGQLIEGLSRPAKSIPSRFFYDARGSRLFEEITRQPEYYQTNAEIGILEQHRRDLATLVEGRALVEFGSGSSRKTELLLNAGGPAAAYVAVDVSETALEGALRRIKVQHPALPLVPIVGDFTAALDLPAVIRSLPKLGFFPGSTIGNFSPRGAVALLGQLKAALKGGQLLIGVDLPNSREVTVAAYNDPAGVTARFNLNLLVRANRELKTDFKLENWEHEATFDQDRHRVDMWLVSRCAQTVTLLGRKYRFEDGERIHTEISQKYPVPAFERLAIEAGYMPRQVWVGDAPAGAGARGSFSVHVLEVPPNA